MAGFHQQNRTQKSRKSLRKFIKITVESKMAKKTFLFLTYYLQKLYSKYLQNISHVEFFGHFDFLRKSFLHEIVILVIQQKNNVVVFSRNLNFFIFFN
jgi:hypothetical protein